MKILVVNCGSSSIKYQLFEMPEEKIIARGLLERLGEEGYLRNHEEGLNFIIDSLTDKKSGVISCVEEITGVGHRVVHGGERFSGSLLITEAVLEAITDFIDLAPLHNPANLAGIKASQKFLPHAVQVVSFDTAFHRSLPEKAYLYAINYDIYARYKIRRYGFHGISHHYVTRKLAEFLHKDLEALNIISCHLGNGCSITAIEKGRSRETSMGFTPLEGLVMGTRCGDIDAAIIFYLLEKGYSADELSSLLNKQSGLLGISGISNDMRDLLAKERQDARAKLAIEIFCYRLKKYIGAYLAVLGDTNAIIFTGGIGENNPCIREEALSGMQGLGIELEPQLNSSAINGFSGLISKETSRVKVYVIPTNEELAIAQDTYKIATLRE